MNTDMTIKTGELSAYALGCGYLESTPADGSSDYYGGDSPAVMMRHDGCWHVHTRIPGETFDDSGRYPRWVETEDGGRTRADWQTFDTLREARAAYRKTATRIRRMSV